MTAGKTAPNTCAHTDTDTTSENKADGNTRPSKKLLNGYTF